MQPMAHNSSARLPGSVNSTPRLRRPTLILSELDRKISQSANRTGQPNLIPAPCQTDALWKDYQSRQPIYTSGAQPHLICYEDKATGEYTSGGTYLSHQQMARAT